MNITALKKKAHRRFSLLILPALLLALAAGWVRGASAAPRVQTMNASGNRNITPAVDPIRKTEGYSTILYNNRNGLPTSEANAIAQTSDGFIWIGSYAGLIRYDGKDFERIDSSTGISNVRCLYVDSRDRLWIGTNDSGVFLMSQGEIKNWNKGSGLSSASIRAVTEDDAGVIYIGTGAGIAMIGPEMKLTILRDQRIEGQTLREFCRDADGLLYGLTETGDILTMRSGRLLSFLSHQECRIKGILSIIPDPRHPGSLYVGTESTRVYYGSLERNFASLGVKDISPLSHIQHFEYINGEFWLCAGNGIGKLDTEGFRQLINVPMNNSVGHVMTDYEGNLWFTSARQGIMKVVPNQFSDLSERYGLPETVVNTTCMYGQQLFIGTDTGLIVVEGRDKLSSLPLTEAVSASGVPLGTDDLLALLKDARIRSIIRDSRDRLWISTWRRYGLLCYDRGRVTSFTENDGLLSDQLRTVSEREDGAILAASRGGVNVIRDGRVTESYGQDAGLAVRDILTVTEGFGHEILLGSDGGGIYVIDGKGTRHIGTEEGLSSDVILRIKRSRTEDVYWIVTSNSLAYMTPDHQVTTIRQFPYANNYDLYETSRGDIWVLASSGIYVTQARELLANGPVKPVFYNIHSGLPYVATANSFSELTRSGDLYISGNVGVIQTNIEHPLENVSRMKVVLPYIDADGKRIYPDASGGFTIPRRAQKTTIYSYVINYSLTDPQVSYRLAGFDDNTTTVSRSGLAPVSYTNLPDGVYQFVMQVKDPIGDANKTASFQIVKEKSMPDGSAGSIIMDLSSLFFMAGLLLYTAAYRRRGRLDDRLFYAMIIINIALAVADGLTYLVDGSGYAGTRPIMIVGNLVFFSAFEIFPYVYMLYLDYRAYQDKQRVRRIKLLYGIPCCLILILILFNLLTGWIFTVDAEGVYAAGPLNDLVFLPVLFYFVCSLLRVRKINIRLAYLGILILLSRVGWGIWFRDISSTALTYTLFLICTHVHVMNRPLFEEET